MSSAAPYVLSATANAAPGQHAFCYQCEISQSNTVMAPVIMNKDLIITVNAGSATGGNNQNPSQPAACSSFENTIDLCPTDRCVKDVTARSCVPKPTTSQPADCAGALTASLFQP